MTLTAVLSPRAAALERIKALVLDTLPSAESKRANGQALDDSFRWCEAAAAGEFTKAIVNSYRASLEARKLSPSTINQRLSAIRKLAVEAAHNGLLPPNIATAISRVKGPKRGGIRSGRWLTREQTENLIAAPNAIENKGKRDRALLAVLIGCGLRRREAVALTIGHIQLRDARWVIVDLIGKGGRVRTVPMPSWTKSDIDSWIAAADIRNGLVFRAINKGGRITGTSMKPRAIFQMVQRFGAEIGEPKLAPHDLRRTFAKLAQKLGKVVRYGCPVREIRNTSNGVRVVYAERGAVRSLEASYCICTMPLSVLQATRNDLSTRVVSAISQVAYAAAYKIAWESRRFWEQENNIYGGISWLSTGPISLEASILANIWYPSGGMLSERGVLVAGYGTENGEFGRLPSMKAKFAASRAAVEKLRPGRSKELTKPLYVAWAKIPFNLGSWVRGDGYHEGPYKEFLAPDGHVYFAGDYCSHLTTWQEGAALSAQRAVEMIAKRVRETV